MERKPLSKGQILLGGHRGLDVIRTKCCVLKQASLPKDITGIRNEAEKLRALHGTGIAPEFLGEGEDYIAEQDLGDSQPIKDGEVLRQNAARALWTLRQHRIAHGDLGYHKNMVFKDDRPIFLDWAESWYYGEPSPDSRKGADSSMLWRTISFMTAEMHPHPDTPRIIRRWCAVAGALGANGQSNLLLEGKTLLDLGCFQGDFCAMAAADGMGAHGVDNGGFRSGENSIELGRRLWAAMISKAHIALFQSDILDWRNFAYDAVLLFSTWAYVYRDYGEERALQLLEDIMAQCRVLFFETQLAGDGPGPAFLKTHEHVGAMLGRFGKAEEIARFPVSLNPSAVRSIWKVVKK